MKRAPVLDPLRPLSNQLQFVRLPGVGQQQSSDVIYESLHSLIHHAVGPYFDAFLSSSSPSSSSSSATANGASIGGGSVADKRDDNDGKLFIILYYIVKKF